MTIRLPADALERADALALALESHPLLGATRVSRSVVIRLALDRGLDALEAEFLESSPPVLEVESIDGRKVAPSPPKPREPREPASYTRAPGAPPVVPPTTVREGMPRKRAPKTAPPTTGPGAELRRWREGQGHTQGQAAGLLELTQATWSRWERGEAVPTAEDADALERLTGIPASSWGAP